MKKKFCLPFWRQNPLFVALLFVQALVVLTFIAPLFAPRLDADINPADFLQAEGLPEQVSMQEENGEAVIRWDVCPDAFTLLSQDYPARYGGYKVDIAYTLRTIGAETLEDPTSVALPEAVIASDGKITAEEFPLPVANGHVSSSFRIGQLSGASHVYLRIVFSDHAAGGEMVIHSIQIREIVRYRYFRLLAVILICAALDFIYYVYLAKKTRWCVKESTKRVAAALVLLSLFASLPLFTDFVQWSGDLVFHLGRLLQVSAELENGQFPVRIMTNMLRGYGYANPLYYCDVFFYLPALLRNWYILSLSETYHIYAVLLNFATACISYICFDRMTGSRNLGLTGACLYTLSSFRLYLFLGCGQIGGVTAVTFMPLVALGLYRIYMAKRPTGADWIPLALGMALIAQCHALSLEMMGIFVLIVCLLCLPRTLCWQRILALGKAALLAVALSGWFLLPFVESMLTQKVVINGVSYLYGIRGSALYPMQIFSFFSLGTGYKMENGTLEPITIGMAHIFVLLLIVCYLFLNRPRRNKSIKGRTETHKSVLLCFITSLLAIYISSSWMPWEELTVLLGEKPMNLLAMVQFPSRYLAIATLFLTMGVVLVLHDMCRKKPQKVKAISLVLVGSVLVTSSLFFFGFMNYHEVVNENNETLSKRVIGGEYTLAGTQTVGWRVPASAANEPGVTVSDYHYENGLKYYTCTNTNTDPAPVYLPVANYQHYHVYAVATGQELPVFNGTNNTVAVQLEPGFAGELLVRYEPPIHWRVAEVISLLSVLGLCLYVWRHRYWRRHRRRIPAQVLR